MDDVEQTLKDMILTIKQERADIKVDSEMLKERKDKLKLLIEEFLNQSLIELTKDETEWVTADVKESMEDLRRKGVKFLDD